MAGSKIQIKKICEYCKSEFYARKKSTRYCSHTCNSRAYKQLKREVKIRTIETVEQEKKVKDIIDRPYLKISEAGRLLGVARQTIYEHIYSGRLKAYKMTSRFSVIKREDIEEMLASHPYEKRQPRNTIVIKEFYTAEQICEKYGISRSSLFAISKRKNIPRTYNRGKTYWSKKHIDAHFAKQAPDDSITEWCSAQEVASRFGMTITAVYSLAYDHNIPKKKVKGKSYYSTKHIEKAKGILDEGAPTYYMVQEAMQKFNLTRDQLYYYTKQYNIPKIKKGRNVFISQRELDEVLQPPTIIQ